MNTKAYIETGIIELYALGLLDKDKSKEVEAYVGQFDVIKFELDAIQETLNATGTQNPVKAPVSKSAIFAAINEYDSAPIANETLSKSEAKASSTISNTHKISLNKYWFGALIAAFLLKGVTIGFLLYQQSQTNEKMEEIQENLQMIQTEKEIIAKAKQELEKDFQVLRSIAKQSITLKATENNGSSLAVVHWDAEAKTTFIDLMNLPSPANGKQYQLWAIVDGKPIDAGIIDSNKEERLLQEMNFISNPQAFAITLEDKGGSKQPTMEQMIVIGYV